MSAVSSSVPERAAGEGSTPRAVIFGCAGTTLTGAEIALFRAANPFGFILFRRNVDNPEQVRALTRALRRTVGRRDAPILIDQEGGRVARLGPPHWPEFPPARRFGEAWVRDPDRAVEAVRANSNVLAAILWSLGITVDCLPVADVPVAGGHDVIGDRAYSEVPIAVAQLALAAAEGLIECGVLPVVKHIPGHGRARSDSHDELPVVDASEAELEAHDFAPFRALRYMPLAMTAHVRYSALDDTRPATLSRVVIGEFIRDRIAFDGLLISDDLGMRALSGPIADRAAAAVAAGCDLALHCNGTIEEMSAVADAVPPMTINALRRWERAKMFVRGRSKPVVIEQATVWRDLMLTEA
ncbi:MAG: beta-N-acetylhexosaminidase [Alphaproteobacteria bacterium]